MPDGARRLRPCVCRRNPGSVRDTVGALDGRVPDAGDAVSAAVLMLGTSIGLHYVPGMSPKPTATAGKVADNIETIYRQTGIPPWKIAEAANVDPIIKQETMAEDPSGNPVFPNIR